MTIPQITLYQGGGSPANIGDMAFDPTLHQLVVFDGTNWQRAMAVSYSYWFDNISFDDHTVVLDLRKLTLSAKIKFQMDACAFMVDFGIDIRLVQLIPHPYETADYFQYIFNTATEACAFKMKYSDLEFDLEFALR